MQESCIHVYWIRVEYCACLLWSQFDDEDLDMDDFDKMLEGEIDGDDQADEEDV